jgi:hypothetical protein
MAQVSIPAYLGFSCPQWLVTAINDFISSSACRQPGARRAMLSLS